MLRFRPTLALVLLGIALAPVSGAAQGEARTHTVKKGDTLWDLAQQYLGDPFRWPEIYRRNTATVQDPNLIYPDQVLIISGDVAATPGTPADVAVTPTDTMPAEEPEALPMPVQGPPPAMTIFNPERYRVVRGQRTSLRIRQPASAVRPGDYVQAPFLWDAAGISGAGSIQATTEADAIGVTLTDRPIQVYERVWVQLPNGAAGTKDEKFLVFRYGPEVKGRGKVVIPTGVVKLDADATEGKASAVLLTKFEDVFTSHRLTALDTLVLQPGVFPTRVEFGLKTTIAYLYGDPVLPPVGHQLILMAGSREGIAPGDQVTIQRSPGKDRSGSALPVQDVAVVQVTRVTPWGASGIIIDQNDGGIREGMAAVVTGKMP